MTQTAATISGIVRDRPRKRSRMIKRSDTISETASYVAAANHWIETPSREAKDSRRRAIYFLTARNSLSLKRRDVCVVRGARLEIEAGERSSHFEESQRTRDQRLSLSNYRGVRP
jgi:hypothetical protein